jgi:hypothetical protein
MWWKGWMIIHTAVSTMLALVWSIQLLRTIHSERESLHLQVACSLLSLVILPYKSAFRASED